MDSSTANREFYCVFELMTLSRGVSVKSQPYKKSARIVYKIADIVIGVVIIPAWGWAKGGRLGWAEGGILGRARAIGWAG
jgi:hypothetical protein